MASYLKPGCKSGRRAGQRGPLHIRRTRRNSSPCRTCSRSRAVPPSLCPHWSRSSSTRPCQMFCEDTKHTFNTQYQTWWLTSSPYFWDETMQIFNAGFHIGSPSVHIQFSVMRQRRPSAHNLKWFILSVLCCQVRTNNLNMQTEHKNNISTPQFECQLMSNSMTFATFIFNWHNAVLLI